MSMAFWSSWFGGWLVGSVMGVVAMLVPWLIQNYERRDR